METVKPAATKASATGRIVTGFPVKPWITRAPTRPPSWKNASAPGTVTSISDMALHPHVVPPGVRRRRPVRILHDAVHRTGGHAPAAPRAQPRHHPRREPPLHHGSELRRARPQAEVAVHAARRLDHDRGEVPAGVSG